MKKILLCLFLTTAFDLSAQQIIDIGIFNNPANSDRLEVRIKPTETVTNGAYTAGVFTVRHLSSYGVTLTAPTALNNPLYRFGIANQGTDGTYSYYSMAFVSPFTVNWNAGTAYPIAILQIEATCSAGDGDFEIINNAWTLDNNGNVYHELNGTEAQNIIYQPSVTVPLGFGMADTIPPTIICSTDKIVETNLNTCQHTNPGTSWDAIGSDNCPGFVLQYILSGATVDTLFSLAGAQFNKGITLLDVTVTDIGGLTANCSFNVTVNDNQPPAITAPPTLVVPANAAACTATGLLLGTPVVSDNCPGTQLSNNAPNTFPLGVTTVTWTITDAAGLSTTATQNVIVQSSLAATGLSLSASTICSSMSANLSFLVSGGVGPLTVLYSANGINTTISNYTNNQPIAISPSITTIYKLVSVTDSLGCSVSPTLLVDTLEVLPNPGLSSLLPSAAQVCEGEPVAFTANGLLPNQSTTFQYTLQPGGAGSITGMSTPGGSFTFPASISAPGQHSMSIQSITVNGCTSNFSTGNSGSYTVVAYPTITSIAPSSSTVCLGAPVQIIANGLPPNVSATIQYTLNGVPGTETVLVLSTGMANLLSNIYPEGLYSVVITSVSVAGCSIASNLSTTFSVDPFQAACGFTVAGLLETTTGDKVDEVLVHIQGTGNGVPFALSDYTDTTGRFRFINTIPLASDYFIAPLKNDNPLNGVTTYDLVLISQHILSIQPIENPYWIIAADANKSGSVTSFDIVELRKLILGIYQELPNNNSWRFVDKYYVFPDTNNPFVPTIPDTLRATNLQTSRLNEDFIGIKVGDVNGTAVLGARAADADRNTAETLFFDITASKLPDMRVNIGEVLRLDCKPGDWVRGYQFTLEHPGLELLDIQPGAGMGHEHFGVFKDALTSSFVPTNPEEGAFSMIFRATTTGVLHQMLRFSDRITRSEAYGMNTEVAVWNLALRWAESDQQRGFELYQNQPNPFSGSTSIPFYLPEADEVSLTVFDALGKVVYAHRNQFQAGPNAFELDAQGLADGTGIWFYKVESSKEAALRKMWRN